MYCRVRINRSLSSYKHNFSHMLQQFFKKSAIAVLVAVLALAAVFSLSTKANAATVDSLTLCIKSSGLTYVIGTGFKVTDCKGNDKVVTINSSANGQPGAQGPVGPVGPQGPAGDKGPTG